MPERARDIEVKRTTLVAILLILARDIVIIILLISFYQPIGDIFRTGLHGSNVTIFLAVLFAFIIIVFCNAVRIALLKVRE